MGREVPVADDVDDRAHPNRDRMWEVFRGDRFAHDLGVTLEGWGNGWAHATWTPRGEHTNFAGSVHGGALFAFADVVFAVACNSWGRHAVALSVDAHFLSAVEVGTPLEARARERSRTRRTGSYHLDVHADGTHVASLHAMAHRASTWHLGEDAWPDTWRTIA